MICDILCRMTFVIVCHKMTFMTDVIWHKVSWTITIWVSNEPSWLVQLIYSIQNHFWFRFLDKNPKYQNANTSPCNSLFKTKRPKLLMKMTSNHIWPLAKCFYDWFFYGNTSEVISICVSLQYPTNLTEPYWPITTVPLNR